MKALYIFLMAIPLLACTLINQAAPNMQNRVPMPAQVTQPPTATQAACTVTAFEALNLRASPNTSAAVLTTLKAGEVVTLRPHPAQGDWIPVTAGGLDGWINSNYCKGK